jgi:hypothetical protein
VSATSSIRSNRWATIDNQSRISPVCGLIDRTRDQVIGSIGATKAWPVERRRDSDPARRIGRRDMGHPKSKATRSGAVSTVLRMAFASLSVLISNTAVSGKCPVSQYSLRERARVSCARIPCTE